MSAPFGAIGPQSIPAATSAVTMDSTDSSESMEKPIDRQQARLNPVSTVQHVTSENTSRHGTSMAERVFIAFETRTNSWSSSTGSETSQESLSIQLDRRARLLAEFYNAGRVMCRKSMRFKLARDFVLALPSSRAGFTVCSFCASLNLRPSDFVITNGDLDNHSVKYDEDYRMGTYKAIFMRAYNCQLCRLIINAMAYQPPEKLANVARCPDTGDTVNDMDEMCIARWEVDGRAATGEGIEQVQDKGFPKTRRLCIRWSNDCFEKFYLVMMNSREAPGEQNFLGRIPPTNPEDKIDLIKNWLTTCQHSHGSTCQAPDKDRERFEKLRQFPYFGVVDVQEMCLKPLPKGGKYVALSYSWGAERPNWFKSQRDNVLKLRKRNSLSEYFDQLPKTHRDAIELVRSLGLRYIWIDALCLVTDDAEAWCRNAAVMDLIYGQACLTICAADGENAHSGLWALAKPGEQGYGRKDAPCTADYSPKLRLLARFPSEVYVEHSEWNSRAWAFQERLFSRRCLIFVKGRVYYECGRTTMSEDIHLEQPGGDWSLDFERSHKKDWKYTSGNVISSYMESVSLYTSRELPTATERLEAFEPIGKLIFNELGADLIYGLPNSHFDFALLWTPQDGSVQESRKQAAGFPSWSWCCWKSVVNWDPRVTRDCRENLHEWLKTQTWITWYLRDSNGNLRLVWDAKLHAPKTDFIPERWRGYSTETADGPDFDIYGRRIPLKHIGLERREFQRALPEFPFQVRTLELGEESTHIVGQRKDLQHLQFFTWSTFFHLKPSHLPLNDDTTGGESSLQTDSVASHGREEIFLRRYDILDKNDYWIGEIVLSSQEQVKTGRHHPHHFIAISGAKSFAYGPPASKGVSSRYVDAISEPWPLFNVLLLGYEEGSEDPTNGLWRSSNTAHRVGLGRVYKEAFKSYGLREDQATGCEWREIILD